MFWNGARAVAADTVERYLDGHSREAASPWLAEVRASWWAELCRPSAEAAADNMGRRRPQAGASPESMLLWQALEGSARAHILNHVLEERQEQGAQDRDRGAFDEDARDCLDASFESTLFWRLAV